MVKVTNDKEITALLVIDPDDDSRQQAVALPLAPTLSLFECHEILQ